jgi:hypothetical protein
MPKQNPSATNAGGGSVRIIKPMAPLARAIKNTGEEARVGKMSEGITARAGAREQMIKNQVAKDMGVSTSKTVKINSGGSSNFQPRIGGHAN